MTKKRFLLPFLLLLLISFNSCDFKKSNTTTVHGLTISAEFKTSRANFIEEINKIGKFEDVTISTTIYEEDGEKTHGITIHLTNPESAPETPIQLKEQAKEIENIAKNNITNIENYDKIVVDYSQQINENGIQKNVTFQTENAL